MKHPIYSFIGHYFTRRSIPAVNWLPWLHVPLVFALLLLHGRQPVHAQTFVHPGISFTRYDLDLLKENITREPWLTGYNALKNDGRSKLSYVMRGPFATVSRVPNLNNEQWKSDMVAIHNLAFMWIFTEDTAYARKATDMLDAWAVVNTTWGGGENMLDIGDYAPYFITGADILRGTYPGWTAAHTAHVKNYFEKVIWPTSYVPGVLRDHNKGAIQLEIAIGVAAFLDDPVKWNQAIEVYRMDAGGGLRNSLPNGEVGDTGRDDHWWGQIQALGWSAEVAWKQGVDLFAELDNRLLAIGELYNQYSIAPQTVTFIPFGGYSAYYTNWGLPPGFRHQHPFNNIIQAGYALRKGIATPYTDQMRTLVGEGAWSFLYLKSADTSTAAVLPPIVYPSTEAVSHLSNIDIGNTGITGRVDNNNDVWTVKGAGNSIANAVNFTFKPVKGNSSIIAKVESNSLAASTTGLMLRESLSTTAQYVTINLNAGATLNSRYNGGAGYTHNLPQAPWWLKIERVGNRVFTFHSHDGVNWTNNSLFITTLPADGYIGLYTISNTTSALNTATFSHVSVTNTSPAGSPAISSVTSVGAIIGTAFNYAITATNNPTVYRASNLPAGLSIDSLTGIISGTPTALGETAITVEAGNASGTGQAVVVVKVTNNVAPHAPTGLAASVSNVTRISLSWAGVGNATSYTVKRSLSAQGPFTAIQTGLSSTSYVDANPVPEVDNYYVVTALAGQLESGNSNVVFSSVPPAIPSRPIVVNKSHQIDLRWEAVAGAATYKIKRGTVSGGPYTSIDSVSVNSYSDTNVTNGSPYYYVVSAVGTTKESGNSPEAFGVPGSSSVTWSAAPATDSLKLAANWVENTLPVNPAILTFRSSADTVLTNDMVGLEVSRIQFEGDANAYSIGGNSLVLKNDLINNSARAQTLSTPLVVDTQLNVNTNTQNITLSGGISGPGSLLKTGKSILFISGANTYSGNTILNGTTGGWPPVNAIAIAGIGTGTPGVPTSGPLGTGKIIMNGGSLYSSGGDATLYNDIEVTAGKRSYFYQTSHAINLRGRLLGSGSIEQDGNVYAGLHLYGDNSEFTGTFISKLRSGNSRTRFEVPQAGSAKAFWVLDASGVDCQSIQFPSGTLHFGALTGRGYIRNNAGGGPVISIGALNTHSKFDGTISNIIHIEKVGTGNLSFTGNHNYGGKTTVKKGKFLLNNNPTNGTFISPVIVEDGAFGGTGKSTAPATIGTGIGQATLEPGNLSIGTLIVGALTFNGPATYAVEINSTSGMADKVVANGITITNATLTFTELSAKLLPVGTAFTLLDNTSTVPVAGTFTGLPEATQVSAGANLYRITYVGGSGNDIVLTVVPKQQQTIAVSPLTSKRLGDADFTLPASASSGLPVVYASTNTQVATVDSTGKVRITGAGTTSITITQAGNATYAAAAVILPFTVFPVHLQVQHKDGDQANPDNNVIKPYLKIVNQDSVAALYSELTARYWLTAENFSGLSTWIDYAELGNKVKVKYVPLAVPRSGAFGYMEYRFEPTAGTLAVGANSGAIQSRVANNDGANLAEADDYSYANSSAYSTNSRITLYRNGVLIWGQEPAEVAPEVKLKVVSLAKNSSPNGISTYLKIHNEGNVPVAYGDIAVRYWFTSEGSTPLNYWIDYAKLGSANITGQFVRLSPALTGADAYLELKVKPTVGSLPPSANTGNIQYRIAKADWSTLIQTNDHSYLASASFADNTHTTVYYQGQLIYGTEPVGTANGLRSGATTTGGLTAWEVYPNPTNGSLTIKMDYLPVQASLQVLNVTGSVLVEQRLENAIHSVRLPALPAGVYYIKIIGRDQVLIKKILKQ